MDKAQVGGGKDLEIRIENRVHIGSSFQMGTHAIEINMCVFFVCMLFQHPFLGGREGEKRWHEQRLGGNLDAMCA